MARYLIVQRGPEIGKRYDLKGNVVTVGRSDDNDIMLDDQYVSRYHAVFKVQGDNLTLIDLGSENPVMIKDTPLEAGTPYVLLHRDIVRIGQNVFSYQDSASAPLRPMVEPEKRPAEPSVSGIAPGSMTGAVATSDIVSTPAPITPPPAPTFAVPDAGATVVGVNLREMYNKPVVSETVSGSSSTPAATIPEPPAPDKTPAPAASSFAPAPSFTSLQDESEATVVGFAPKAPPTPAPQNDLEISFISNPAPKNTEPPPVHEEQETAPTGAQPVPQGYEQSNYGQYQQPADPNQAQTYNYGQYNYGQYQQPATADSNQPQQYNYGQYQQPATSDPNQPQGQPDSNQAQQYGQYNYGQYQQPYNPNQPQPQNYGQPDPNQAQQYGQYGQYYQQYGQYGQYQGYQGYQYGQYQANPDATTSQGAGDNVDPTQVADYASQLKGQPPATGEKKEDKKEEKKEIKSEEYDPDNAPTMVIRIDKTKQ